jgi:hypothetical protein
VWNEFKLWRVFIGRGTKFEFFEIFQIFWSLTVKMVSFWFQMAIFEFKQKMWTNQTVTHRYRRSAPVAISIVDVSSSDTCDEY